MYFALREIALQRITKVSLRLFMRVAHNKDFRISTQTFVLTAITQTGAGRNERAVIECDYNWKFHDEYPRFFEKLREVSLDRIRSRELSGRYAPPNWQRARICVPFLLCPISSPFRFFLFSIYRHSLLLFCLILSSDFNSNWEKIPPIVFSIPLLATTAFEERKIN